MRSRRSRTLTVFVLAVAAHVALLALLALEQPELVFRPGPAVDRQAVVISLAPPPLFAPPPARKRPRRHEPQPPPTLPSEPPAPAAAAPPAPIELPDLARPVFRVWPRPLPGGVNWGGLGDFCDDPAHRLSPEARERCLKRWAKPTQQIAEIPPMIAREGKIEFDRRIHCREVYENAPLPVGTQMSDNGMFAGLGRAPSFKECPPADR
jgi:hypothetical protein